MISNWLNTRDQSNIDKMLTEINQINNINLSFG